VDGSTDRPAPRAHHVTAGPVGAGGVEDNKRLVARAVAEVINGGHLDAVEQLYAQDIVEAVRDWVAPFREAFPDVRMETVELVGEGDTVVGHFRCSGTQTGTWMGRPPTGRSFRDVREVYWFTVRGGRIVEWWGLEDNDDRRRQLRASGSS
jgi:predicted ester cyclase